MRDGDIDRVRGLEKQLGLKAGECPRTYGEVEGEQTIERIGLPVKMAEELWDLRTFTRDLIRKLDVMMPKLEGVVSFQSLRQGSSAYDGPSIFKELNVLRNILGLPNPAAHPREFYPPDYCKPCDGSGQVPAGEGIASQLTRMNMHRLVTAVKDMGRAKTWLLNEGAAATPDETEALLSDLPLDIEYIGKRMASVVNVETGDAGSELRSAQTKEDADLSMFEVEVRRHDWNKDKKFKDVCRECRGTGGRGLPVPTLEWDTEGNPIMATDVDE